jgi:DNA mismatch endonuclease (patch repair protein)
MRSNKRRDTGPELAVRRAVHALGLRYYVDRRPLPGLRRTADLLFPRVKIAVFVDGCFWHGCPVHHTVARTNADFWADKVRRNRERDADTDRRLNEAGWRVVRVWEHEPPAEAAQRVRREVIAAVDASEHASQR